jgi:hypothetical protein
MDGNRFDSLTRAVSTLLSRRTLAGTLGLRAMTLPGLADAKKHKHKHKKKHKVKFNDFGCVNVGNFCKNNDQCCSGICQGKKGKKKCQAHDQSTCQSGQTITECGGSTNVTCTTSSGAPDGVCLSTTGQGEFCAGFATCFVCAKDADCQALCGPQAACIACPACAAAPGNAGTACAAADESTCMA